MGTLADLFTKRPVGAKRLHRCLVRSDNDETWQASVFPFFGSGGGVQALLIVRRDEPGLYAAPYEAGRLHLATSLLDRRVVTVSSHLQPVTEGDTLARLARLWHYDPWWVLREPPFADHVATPALKATNCADRLPPGTKSLAFTHDLARVRSIQVEADDDVRWQPEWLPTPSRPPRAGRAGSGRTRWVLDPIWMHATR